MNTVDTMNDYNYTATTRFSREALCPTDDKFCEDIQCKRVCNQKAECKMESRPVCEVPKCRVICDPPKTPQCTVRTSAPVCKTVCKKVDGCYSCSNVCQPLKSWLECVKPKPSCHVKCDPPNCKKEFELPKAGCAKPTCKLVCPPSRDGSFSYTSANLDTFNNKMN